MQIPLLSIRNLSKKYEINNSGIEDINFSLSKGEILTVLGESGSGKSTLLKTIYGLIKPDSGEVLFEGVKVKGPDEQLVPGHPAMRMVTQDFSLNIYANVYDNIASMLPNTNIKLKESRTLEVMERLRIAHLKDKKIISLSGGEQQRVAIARILVVSGLKVVLLDEPFSQIDAMLKSKLRSDLKRIASEVNLAIIIVTHDPVDALSVGTKILILKDTRLVQLGDPELVYNQPINPYAAKLLGNSNIYTKEAAELLGIKTSKEIVAIYPEWVQLTGGWSGKRFVVEEVSFNGFYEELLVSRKGIQLRTVNTHTGSIKKGQHVHITLPKYIEY